VVQLHSVQRRRRDEGDAHHLALAIDNIDPAFHIERSSGEYRRPLNKHGVNALFSLPVQASIQQSVDSEASEARRTDAQRNDQPVHRKPPSTDQVPVGASPPGEVLSSMAAANSIWALAGIDASG